MTDQEHSVKAPRVIRMIKSDKGYGFNLHGERGVVGQFISAVDDGGPAQLAGLCIGDRVIEVNGVNVEAATHNQVVTNIKEGAVETTLLVVDKVTDDYLKQHNIPITADLAKSKDVEVKAEILPEQPVSDEKEKESNGVETVNANESRNDQEVEEVGLSVEEYLLTYSDHEGKPAENQEEVNGEVVDTVDGAVPKQLAVVEKVTTDEKEIKGVESKDPALKPLEMPVPDERRMERKSKMTPPEEPPPTPPSERTEPPAEPQAVTVEEPVVKEPAKVGGTQPESSQPVDSLLKKNAALPKPKRKEIKEKKGADWASRAAIFNNL